MSLHGDSYLEHLLYPRSLGEEPSPSGENPQEAPPPPGGTISSLSPASDADEKTFAKQYLSLLISAVLALALLVVVFALIPYFAVESAMNNHYNEMLYWTSGAFVLIAVPMSAYGIIQHLVNVRSCCIRWCRWWGDAEDTIFISTHSFCPCDTPSSITCHKCRSM